MTITIVRNTTGKPTAAEWNVSIDALCEAAWFTPTKATLHVRGMPVSPDDTAALARAARQQPTRSAVTTKAGRTLARELIARKAA